MIVAEINNWGIYDLYLFDIHEPGRSTQCHELSEMAHAERPPLLLPSSDAPRAVLDSVVVPQLDCGWTVTKHPLIPDSMVAWAFEAVTNGWI